MAKKKEQELSYLQVPLPQGQKKYKSVKVNFGGLNKRNDTDSGELSMERNISTAKAPYLTPSQKSFEVLYNGESLKYENVVGMHGYENKLLVVYYKESANTYDNLFYYMDYIFLNSAGSVKRIIDGVLLASYKKELMDFVYETCTFNHFNALSGDLLTGTVVEKILINPFGVSVYKNIFALAHNEETGEAYETIAYGSFNSCVAYRNPNYIEYGANAVYYLLKGENIYHTERGFCYFTGIVASASGRYEYTAYLLAPNYSSSGDVNYMSLEDWGAQGISTMPKMLYATTNLSRLFGVDETKVFASGFNDYANWRLDTAEETNADNAWCSMSQASPRAKSDFTGIGTYNERVYCFKRDMFQVINNTKNPFRVADAYNDGCIDNRSIKEAGGRLFFVSEDGVKCYSGSYPENISYKLNEDVFLNAVSGSDGRNYYLYTSGKIYVYDTFFNLWSERECGIDIYSFANNEKGLFVLGSNGNIYKLDTANYSQSWSFETEDYTAVTSSAPSLDIKHLKNIRILADFSPGSTLKIYALYNNEAFNEEASHLIADILGKDGLYVIRVIPRKTACYAFKLHFEGYGYIEIRQLELLVENGGEINRTE